MKKYILLNLFFVLLACNQKNEEVKPEMVSNENEVKLSQDQLKMIDLETITLSNKSIATTIKVNGTVNVPPQNTVLVNAPLSCYVVKSNLITGMKVSKGQSLVTLKDQQFVQIQQDYLIAKSKLAYAEEDYARQKELNNNQATSDKTMQLALAERNSWLTQKNALTQRLELIGINSKNISASSISNTITIYAPISGYIAQANVTNGKYVAPSDVLFEIVNIDAIILNFKIFENNATSLKIGQEVTAYSNNEVDKKYISVISHIGKTINNEGLIDVHCVLKDKNTQLLPGMYINADIKTSTSFSESIPETCVVTFENKNYVFIDKGDATYEIFEVFTGTEFNGFVQIDNHKDLLDKKIVNKGAYALLMEMKNVEE